MIHTLKTWPALLLTPMLFIMAGHRAKTTCDATTATPRGQKIQIKHQGCKWIRIEYSTSVFKCKGTKCEELNMIAWHDVTIDSRSKDKIFYYEAARGPANVSYVKEANVLDCSCD